MPLTFKIEFTMEHPTDASLYRDKSGVSLYLNSRDKYFGSSRNPQSITIACIGKNMYRVENSTLYYLKDSNYMLISKASIGNQYLYNGYFGSIDEKAINTAQLQEKLFNVLAISKGCPLTLYMDGVPQRCLLNSETKTSVSILLSFIFSRLNKNMVA